MAEDVREMLSGSCRSLDPKNLKRNLTLSLQFREVDVGDCHGLKKTRIGG